MNNGIQMKKIGIITILKVNNYGAELQAYATQAYLKKLGYDAEIIDYLFYKNPQFIRTKRSAPLFHFPFKKRLAEFVYPIWSQLKSLGNRRQQKLREQKFAEFHHKNTSMSVTYRSIDELYGAHMDYDVYLTGSDQVWNPGIYSSVAPYFLDFAPHGCRRIAYASSFGVSQIPEEVRPYYAEFLSHYDAIGVREKNAVDLVYHIAHKTAEWVLDPTLLLSRNEWMRVASPVCVDTQSPYILLYELTPCDYIQQLAHDIKSKTNWQIIRICKNASREDRDATIVNVIDAGPAEFLYLFSKASLIITNSFHGTAFSINFHRPFYTVLPLRKQNNSRQRSLLELFGLTNRLLVEGAPYPNQSVQIDYTAVDEVLEAERAKSTRFLKTAINGKESVSKIV